MAARVPQQLNPAEKMALGVLLQRGVVSGQELVSRMGDFTADQILAAVQGLMSYELVDSSPPYVSSVQDFMGAYFSIRSFATGLAKDLLYQK